MTTDIERAAAIADDMARYAREQSSKAKDRYRQEFHGAGADMAELIAKGIRDLPSIEPSDPKTEEEVESGQYDASQRLREIIGDADAKTYHDKLILRRKAMDKRRACSMKILTATIASGADLRSAMQVETEFLADVDHSISRLEDEIANLEHAMGNLRKANIECRKLKLQAKAHSEAAARTGIGRFFR